MNVSAFGVESLWASVREYLAGPRLFLLCVSMSTHVLVVPWRVNYRALQRARLCSLMPHFSVVVGTPL